MSPRGQISRSDRSLLASLRAWAGVEALPALGRFGAERARKLAPALGSAGPIESLLLAHAAQVGADPSRVHPSWYVRALLDEMPSVQRVVIRDAAEPLRSLLLRELAIDPADLEPDHPDDAEARQVALALWTERLVGDLPPGPDDPPAVVALTHLGPIGLYRLLRLCGIAKHAQVRAPEGGRSASRRAFLAGRIAQPDDPRLLQIAANDWLAASSFGRHALAGLGLMTLGRLIVRVEPYRLRWALQHVPYPIAKRLRVLAGQPVAAVKAVQAWELGFLEAASARLAREGLPSLDLDIDPDRSRLA